MLSIIWAIVVVYMGIYLFRLGYEYIVHSSIHTEHTINYDPNYDPNSIFFMSCVVCLMGAFTCLNGLSRFYGFPIDLIGKSGNILYGIFGTVFLVFGLWEGARGILLMLTRYREHAPKTHAAIIALRVISGTIFSQTGLSLLAAF